jgi:hypothetical protein
MASNYKKLQQLSAELMPYAELEGSEVGEVCDLMVQLSGYEPYISAAFSKALEKEMTSQLKYFKANTKIVEEIEEVKHPVKRLEWND